MDEKTQKLLSREIKSMDYVKHPNIIRLYEVREEFSTRFVRGLDLSMKCC